ncbi:MAG TPA: DUF1552 domain-containing protein [Verrucomicrobiales bacterium]|nr:DUF1552 domain-containing protein [Verrucomicrobiales bacterium]
MRARPISRRTVLRGAGASVALPFLEVMAPATRATAASSPEGPRRLAFLFMPNGVRSDTWTPFGQDECFDLSPALLPLAPVKSEVLVLTQLMNANSIGGDGHYAKSASWLTGHTISKTTGRDLDAGSASVDQVVAEAHGAETKLPSLQLGIEPMATGVDTNVNYTRLYASHIAWSSPTTPLPNEINPRLAFDRLFRAPTPEEQRRKAADRSVLDLVLEDARSLKNRVGRNDQQKLNEYLESLRSVERRIEQEALRLERGENLAPELETEIRSLGRRINGTMEGQNPGRRLRLDHTEHVRLMLDILVLALWSDSTRVGTFMFGNAVSGRNFSFLDGVDGGHHEISHHQNDPEKLRCYEEINRWHVAQFVYLIERMRSIREGERTLLDQSMILFGSALRDGNSHNPRNLPLVLAGRGGGTIRTGRHLVYPERTPLCNLYLSLLERMGAPRERFGDSTGLLPQLA